MSKQAKSEVGANGPQRQRSTLGLLQDVGSTSTLNRTSKAATVTSTVTAPSVPAPEEPKKKGILVNIGGRLRTISDTTLNLLKHGTQLDISTHLMDKKLVGGYTCKQLEIAVAHARLEKKKRMTKTRVATARESSAEKALEEALKKYGEEAEADSANRTISDILLQYSSKPDISSPVPTRPQSADDSELRPPTPLVADDLPTLTKNPFYEDLNLNSSSQTPSPPTEKAPNRGRGSKKNSPNRCEILQQPFSSRIQGGLIRKAPDNASNTSTTSFTSNSRKASRGTPLSTISSGIIKHFSPRRGSATRIGVRLASPSPLRRLSSRQVIGLKTSMTRTNVKSSLESSRSSVLKKKAKHEDLNKMRNNSTDSSNSNVPRDKSTKLPPSIPRGFGLPLMPPPPSPSTKLYLPDSVARRHNILSKPPVPRQQIKGVLLPGALPGSERTTSHLSSQRRRSNNNYGEANERYKNRLSHNHSQPLRGVQRNKRSVPAVGERVNRFFHGEKITSEVRAARKEIKYYPEDPDYRTVTDPTYGRYRHFYMGMIERLPVGFPVSLRNALFPLPPPPEAPSLLRYRNPLKFPLRKVGLEKDDFITRTYPQTKPVTYRPPLHLPKVYAYAKPPVPPFRSSGGRPAGPGDSNNNHHHKGHTQQGQQSENFWEVQEKRRKERLLWAERLREVIRNEREFVEAYKPYFREEEEYREYDSNFEEGPRAFLMKLLENHLNKNKSKSLAEEEEEERRRKASLKEPTNIPSLTKARLEPFRFISNNDYYWSLRVTDEVLNQRRRYVNWRECDLHDVYDMRCILEVYGLLDILPYLKYERKNDYRSTTMETIEFFKDSVYIRGFENILLAVVSDMTYGKADKKRLGRYFGRNPAERASVRQWLTYAIIHIRGKSRLGENVWSELEGHLQKHNFFATAFYSVTDVLMYFSLYPFFKPLPRHQRERYPFVADFIRTVQRDENVLRANKRLMIRNWEEIHVLKRPSQ